MLPWPGPEKALHAPPAIPNLELGKVGEKPEQANPKNEDCGLDWVS